MSGWSAQGEDFGTAEEPGGSTFGIPKSVFRTVDKYASIAGVGLSPFVSTPLQWAGGDDRALLLKYRTSGAPFLFPGTRAFQGIQSFVTTGLDPDNTLPDDVKERISLGQSLSIEQLHDLYNVQKHGPDAKGFAKNVGGALPLGVPGQTEDEFDIYRTQRVLANMVGVYMKQGHTIEERQSLTREALAAMYSRSGSLWKKAREDSRKEADLAVVSGWLLGMPIRQYPNGEDTSRGIDELFSQLQTQSRENDTGNMTAGLYAMFPEHQVRQATFELLKSTDKQDTEVSTALFNIDLNKVHGTYDQNIENRRSVIAKMQEQGLLLTSDGRRQIEVVKGQLNSMLEGRSNAIEDLDKRYADRKTAPSLNRTPVTRALMALEQKYYDIETGSTDFEVQQAAQKAFVSALPLETTVSAFTTAVDSYRIRHAYSTQITAAYDAGDREKGVKLAEERDAAITKMTDEVAPNISRTQFQGYLDRNKRVPTPQEGEYDQAKAQIAEFSAIKDRGTALGYTSKQVSQLSSNYWKTHPLLAKYYGHEDVTPKSFKDIQLFDRMENIWDHYYNLEGGAQARIDYLAMALEELNTIRTHFGMKPIVINDPYWEKNAPPPRYEGSNPGGYQ